MRFLGSLAVCAAVALGYALLSNFSYFIPIETLYAFAFGWWAPQNILFHMLIHTGHVHLIENLAMLAAFALVAEAVLSSRDIVAIFFLSGMFAAALFGALNPEVALIGSSAGISGLVSSAILLNPKKAIPAIIIVPLFVAFVLVPIADGSFFLYKISFEQKSQEVGTEIEKAVQRGDVQEAARLRGELEKIETQKQKAEVGETFQRETPTDALVHTFGAIFGVAYIFFLRRKKLIAGIEQYNMIIDLAKSKIKKLGGSKGLE